MKGLLTKPEEMCPEAEIPASLTRKSISFKELRREFSWPLFSPLTFLREIFAGWRCLFREMLKIPSIQASFSHRLFLLGCLLVAFGMPAFLLHHAVESVILLRHTVSDIARLFGGQG